jgi:hypothetical protein
VKQLSGATRGLVLAVSLGVLLALVATVANSLGLISGFVGQAGLPAAEVLTVCSGIMFVVWGTRFGRAFGVFAVLVVPAWAVVQAVYERAGDPWILSHSLVLYPLLVLLQLLAPLAALSCVVLGLYAAIVGTRGSGD